MQKIEARVAADEDLKLADLLKYYLRESQAAKVRRVVSMLNWQLLIRGRSYISEWFVNLAKPWDTV